MTADELLKKLSDDRKETAAMFAEERRELITALNRRDVQIARLALLVDRLLKDRRGEPYVDPRTDPDWKGDNPDS